MLVDKETYVPGKVVKDLKPSQLIRIGAAIRPQARGRYFDGVGSCVMGALYEAMGHKLTVSMHWSDVQPAIKAAFPRLSIDFQHYLAIRNNSGESRESIADWLEAQGL
jgi:hypothetical protein